MLEWYRRAGRLKYVALRYFNACGATRRCGESHRPETHLIPLLLEVALGQRETLRLFGTDYDTPDGTCIRDYVHVSDIAQAHLLARRLADGLSPYLKVEAPQTNIVFADGAPDGLIEHLKQQGVLATGLYKLRFVTHLDVDAAGVDRAIAAVRSFCEKA